jgi:hypothetical protein
MAMKQNLCIVLQFYSSFIYLENPDRDSKFRKIPFPLLWAVIKGWPVMNHCSGHAIGDLEYGSQDDVDTSAIDSASVLHGEVDQKYVVNKILTHTHTHTHYRVVSI